MPEKTLRAESSSPLYAQLMERLRMDILEGTYPVGEKIPAEHQLEGRYGVSRVTVRRALQELTNEGLLERKQGKGTFVAQRRQKAIERGIQGFHDACREAGKRPSVRFLSAREVEASPEDRSRLQLMPEADVLEIQRVLAADGEPVILEKMRFSMAYAWLENAELGGSIYRILQEYGIHAEKGIYDLSLKRVTGMEAEKLEMAEGETAMQVTQVVYDQKGRPLHVSEMLVRGDRYTLRI